MKVKIFKIDDRDKAEETEKLINKWLDNNKVTINNIISNVTPAYGFGNGSWIVIIIFYEV